MRHLLYFWALVLNKLRREKHKESITKFFAKMGVTFVGDGPVYINCNIALGEPHLITIGENTTIAGGGTFGHT